MKRSIILLLVILLIPAIAEARQSIIFTGDELRLDLTRYDPSPIQPGSKFDVHFTAFNIEDIEVTDINIELAETFPFTIVSQENNPKSLQPGQSQDFKYTLEVNKNVVANGNYSLFVKYKSRNQNKIKIEKFNIYITRTTTKNTFIEIDAPEIAPGSQSTIKATIKNLENYDMQDVSLILNLSSSTIPLAPYGSTTERKIPSIPKNSEVEVEFGVIALASTTGGIFKIPLRMEHHDELGNEFISEETTAILIGSQPELEIEQDETTIYEEGENGEVSLKIINKGSTNTKLLTIQLQETSSNKEYLFGLIKRETQDYEILSQSDIYVGNIDSDDYETATYRLKIKNLNNNQLSIPLILEYKDVNNKDYIEAREINLKINSKEDLGLDNGSPWLIITISILVLLYIIRDYRLWNKKNENKILEDYVRFKYRKILKKKTKPKKISKKRKKRHK